VAAHDNKSLIIPHTKHRCFDTDVDDLVLHTTSSDRCKADPLTIGDICEGVVGDTLDCFSVLPTALRIACSEAVQSRLLARHNASEQIVSRIDGSVVVEAPSPFLEIVRKQPIGHLLRGDQQWRTAERPSNVKNIHEQ